MDSHVIYPLTISRDHNGEVIHLTLYSSVHPTISPTHSGETLGTNYISVRLGCLRIFFCQLLCYHNNIVVILSSIINLISTVSAKMKLNNELFSNSQFCWTWLHKSIIINMKNHFQLTSISKNYMNDEPSCSTLAGRLWTSVRSIWNTNSNN